MWLNFSSVIILTGFALVILSVPPVSSTLQFIRKTLTWPDARKYCKKTYTDLAPVKTYNDLLMMIDEASRQGVTWPIWIGLYNDINSWRWSYHDLSLSAMTLRKWSTGEPSNGLMNEQCAMLNMYGAWNDNPCSTRKPFICYNAQYPGDSRFVGIPCPQLNWTNAQTYCRSFHTDLATALDETDNSLLQQIAADQGDSWFGLYRDGWTWTDHTKAVSTFWESGQPNYFGDLICGRFYRGILDGMRCISTHYFFCHNTPPIKRQMLKLQVTSDQNVLGDDVQSSLLMKILKKLEEHGLSKVITVTWRVQPDGNVFYQRK